MPVKEREIMIGNWFRHADDDWSYRKDDPKYEANFQWTDQDWYQIGECCMSLDYINPIHISSEILEASGFKYNVDMGWWYIQPELENIEFRINIIPYTNEWVLYKGFMRWNDELTSCYSIHEMQNVYHLIFKGELNIVFHEK